MVTNTPLPSPFPKPRSPGWPPRARVLKVLAVLVSSYMMCFCFCPMCGFMRRPRGAGIGAGVGTFVPARGFSFLLFDTFPWRRVSHVKMGREGMGANPCACIASLYLLLTLSALFSSFSFLFLVTQKPANAMRQLFQAVISLCGRGCGSHTVFFFLSFFFFSFSLFSGTHTPRGRRSSLV